MLAPAAREAQLISSRRTARDALDRAQHLIGSVVATTRKCGVQGRAANTLCPPGDDPNCRLWPEPAGGAAPTARANLSQRCARPASRTPALQPALPNCTLWTGPRNVAVSNVGTSPRIGHRVANRRRYGNEFDHVPLAYGRPACRYVPRRRRGRDVLRRFGRASRTGAEPVQPGAGRSAHERAELRRHR